MEGLRAPGQFLHPYYVEILKVIASRLCTALFIKLYGAEVHSKPTINVYFIRFPNLEREKCETILN